MVRYNSDVENIKHSVLTEVARMCYEELDEQYAKDIPYKIIPGMSPRYRCCVFKEREILRQRILLARGQRLAGESEVRLINVIKEACHGCPINRYQVTQNCQKCLAKSCVKECRFGAISITPAGAYIDQAKCRECGKCVSSCPYNAITDTQRPCVKGCPVDAIGYDSDKLAVINKAKCIDCGNCIKSCPFGAISESSEICEVIKNIKNTVRPVIALIAPSIEGQFGKVNLGGIKNAILSLGFSDVVEVSLGADEVAKEEANEVAERIKEKKTTITSCCPALYNMVTKHFPSLTECISDTVSPMIAANIIAKKSYSNPVTVFIGPCIAKKSEAKRGIKNNVDYVLTFEELSAMLDAKSIVPENADNNYTSTEYGRGFALSGGVAAAVCNASITPPTCHVANGGTECYKALFVLKANRLNADVLEGMVCEGGCIAGPAVNVSPLECKKNRQQSVK